MFIAGIFLVLQTFSLMLFHAYLPEVQLTRFLMQRNTLLYEYVLTQHRNLDFRCLTSPTQHGLVWCDKLQDYRAARHLQLSEG